LSRQPDPKIRIRSIRLQDSPSFRAALDSVAKEREYLSLTRAFPPASTRKFVAANIRNRHSQFVAICGGKVVGWCDIIPRDRPSMKHVGVLGIGIVKGFRDRGLGTRLLAAAVTDARRKGLKKIELEVFADNRRAVALYRKAGFVREGLKKKAVRLGGFRDMILMARFFPGRGQSG
jgi:ribosomal protein S18 acetylase RimI-like enzyme